MAVAAHEELGASARVLLRLGRQLWAIPLVPTLAPFLPLVVLWQVVVAAGVFPPAFFPGPGGVVDSFVTLVWQGVVPEYTIDSLTRLAVGATMGIGLGVPLGLAIGLNAVVSRFTWPLVLFFQSIGDIAWLPILVIWAGFSLTTVSFVIVYTVLFPIVLNTALGVRTIRPEMVRAARSLGAGPCSLFLEVILPATLPSIITGLRSGLGYGWRALIAAEIIVGTSGLGFMMFDARRAGRVTEVILGMIILAIFWYLVDALVLVPLERATIQRWGLVTKVE